MNAEDILNKLEQDFINEDIRRPADISDPLTRWTDDIPKYKLKEFIETARRAISMEQNKPITKFIFVEDGSIDTDELESELSTRNPEIKIVVYRQGGKCPILEEVLG